MLKCGLDGPVACPEVLCPLMVSRTEGAPTPIEPVVDGLDNRCSKIGQELRDQIVAVDRGAFRDRLLPGVDAAGPGALNGRLPPRADVEFNRLALAPSMNRPTEDSLVV
jgi:hypothetical protein